MGRWLRGRIVEQGVFGKLWVLLLLIEEFFEVLIASSLGLVCVAFHVVETVKTRKQWLELMLFVAQTLLSLEVPRVRLLAPLPLKPDSGAPREL